MKHLVVIPAVLVIVLGIAGLVYGEADDSPGLQLIGVVLIVGALALGVRTFMRSR
jgi:membrane protein implicated in regulation of membrane protease activity